jgi:hypothetical protein
MLYSPPEQRCFPPLPGYTVRADCDGGALSSDFGALLRRGIDRQSGFTERLAAARRDRRHPSDTAHALRALCAQRLSHIASGEADGNDANRLRHDPRFQRSGERLPLDPTPDWARAPTCSRLAHRVTRTDLSRLTQACVDPCMASSPEPPAAMVLDLDPSEAPTQGPQAWIVYHHPSQSDGYGPLCMFAGTSPALVTACLRPGKRPPGAAHAMIVVRRLSYLRRHWPSTPSRVRGDRHGAHPEVLEVIAPRRLSDGVFGLAGHPVVRRQAAPGMQEARNLCPQRTALAHASGEPPPLSRRGYEDFSSAAASWAQPWRVIVKAAGMAVGDHPRVVVPS